MTHLDHVDAVRCALSELGYPDDAVRPPTAAERIRFPGVRVFARSTVDPAHAWKAGALVALTTIGADAPIRCQARSGRAWADCPGHPAGAILSHTDPGCAS